MLGNMMNLYNKTLYDIKNKKKLFIKNIKKYLINILHVFCLENW